MKGRGQVLIACGGCGAIIPRRPCGECQRRRDRERGSGWTRYGPTWRKNKAEAIRRHPWCEDCGSTEDLTGDHRWPKSKGGTDAIENIAVRCDGCNKSKGARVESSSEKSTALVESEPRLLG